MNLGPQANKALTGKVTAAILPGTIYTNKYFKGRRYAIQKSAGAKAIGYVVVDSIRPTTWAEMTEDEIEAAGIGSALDLPETDDDSPYLVVRFRPAADAEQYMRNERRRGGCAYTERLDDAIDDAPVPPAEWLKPRVEEASRRDDELRRSRSRSTSKLIRETENRLRRRGVDVESVLSATLKQLEQLEKRAGEAA